MSQATARLPGEGGLAPIHLTNNAGLRQIGNDESRVYCCAVIQSAWIRASVLTRSDNEARASYLRQLETRPAQLPLRGHPTGRLALMLSQNERQLLRSQARCKEKPRHSISHAR
jgi:hypothetical protein